LYAENYQGPLYAVDAATGQQLWSVNSYAPYSDGVENPAIDGNRIFAACGSVDSVCAFNAKTGALIWSRSFSPSSNPIYSGLTVDHGMVFLTTGAPNGGTILGLSEKTGAVQWSFTSPSLLLTTPGGPPAVSRGILYVSGYRGLCAVKEGATQLLWCNTKVGPSPTAITATVGVRREHVIITASTGGLSELRSNGRAYWTESPGTQASGIRAAFDPDQQLIIYNFATGLAGIDPNGGGIARWIWFDSAPNSTWGTPTVANGVVYIQSLGAILDAFRDYDGTLLYSDQLTGDSKGSFANPVVANGYVYSFCEVSPPCPPLQSGAWTVLNHHNMTHAFKSYRQPWFPPLDLSERADR